MAQQFKGFSHKSLAFLTDVRKHNSKEWFEEHRHIYNETLLEPMRTLIEQLSSRMLMIDDSFETRPAIDKTISRLNRDTRFSKDKSCYRSSMWLTFKRQSKDWKDAPVYFFELSPDIYRYGIGYYSASKKTMDLFRELVLNNPREFAKIARSVKAPFELYGESYKRPLVKNLPEEIADWYNRKSFAVIAESHDIEDLFSPNLLNRLEHGFVSLEPLYHYLMEVEKMKGGRF